LKVRVLASFESAFKRFANQTTSAKFFRKILPQISGEIFGHALG